MNAFLRVLDGGRAGARFPLHPDHTSVLGRNPGIEIPLDAGGDLAVSGTHAEFSFREGQWQVRDLESRNGTLLNGRFIREVQKLSDGDELRFGPDGPRARFEVGASGTSRIRRQSARGMRRLGLAAAAMIAVMAVVAILLVQRERTDRSVLLDEQASLHALVDSLLARDQEVTGELNELDEALSVSRGEVERLRQSLQAGEERGADDSGQLLALRRELEAATQALARQQLAASLDFSDIEDSNRPAVVLIFVETGQGRVVTGTGFAIRDDALLVTARHLLEDESGQLNPHRIAVQFADSRQVWPAEVVEVSGTADLALLRAGPITGAVPRVRGLSPRSRTVQSGWPVAVIGFPLGGSISELEPDGGRPPARPLLSAGVVQDVSSVEITVQGYGEPGASGSPVLDSEGRVVGVVKGGERTPRGGILVVIPASEVLALIERAGVQVP